MSFFLQYASEHIVNCVRWTLSDRSFDFFTLGFFTLDLGRRDRTWTFSPVNVLQLRMDYTHTEIKEPRIHNILIFTHPYIACGLLAFASLYHHRRAAAALPGFVYLFKFRRARDGPLSRADCSEIRSIELPTIRLSYRHSIRLPDDITLLLSYHWLGNMGVMHKYLLTHASHHPQVKTHS
jgi:hypothetical protein